MDILTCVQLEQPLSQPLYGCTPGLDPRHYFLYIQITFLVLLETQLSNFMLMTQYFMPEVLPQMQYLHHFRIAYSKGSSH